ncbi:MAG: transglutaminase-like cysteine peptidase [Geminicoccaceae bacterium]
MNDPCSRRKWLLGAVSLLACEAAFTARGVAIDGPTYWQMRLDRWSGHDAGIPELVRGCDGGLCAVIEKARKLSAVDAVYLVNRVVNSLPFWSEPEGSDDWQSPLETWRVGGDCEDLALLKAAMLAEAGFAPTDMRLIVADVPYWGLHAFLGVRAGDRWWRLDNLEEACTWDGGPIAYPGPAFDRLWLSPPIETGAYRRMHKVASG